MAILDNIKKIMLSFTVKSGNKKSDPYLEKEGLNRLFLEDFLSDPNADVGTGLLAGRGHGFCFTLKQSSRWSYDESGVQILPFGGIGGKLEKNEYPAASLHREAKEEVDSDVNIDNAHGPQILLDGKGLKNIILETRINNEPLPLIIFQSPRAEVGRKPYTNVLIYSGRFLSKHLKPIDDPAILEMGLGLLTEMTEYKITVKEFLSRGGRINSNIDLPENGILKPIGTALAAVKCYKEGLIDEGILTEKE